MNEYSGLVAASLDSSQAQFLAQMSHEEFRNYARELACIIPGNTQPAEYLKCLLSSSQYLLSLTALYEVVMPPHRFAFLPAMPAWMLGLVAWRSEVIAAIDLEAFLSQSAASANESLSEGSLLIAAHDSLPVALYVPAIELTKTFQIEQVLPPAEAPNSTQAPFVKGMYGSAHVLDVAALLSDVVQRIGTATSDG